VKTGAPIVTITGGPAATTSSTTATVTFDVTDPGLLGTLFDTVECSLDGGAYSLCGGSWTGTGLSAGMHTLTVRATDPAANRGTASHSWTVTAPADTTAPNVGITSGPAASSTATTASVGFTVDDPTATVTCSVDGGPATPCSSPWSASGLGVGSHTLLIRAVDAAGNVGSASRSWTVTAADTTPPSITGISGPSNSTSTSATVTWSVDDPTATVTCALNGVSSPCTSSSWSATGLSVQSYNLVITATDAAGNSGNGSYSWTVQPTAQPTTITFTKTPDPQDSSGNPKFKWSETTGINYFCSLDGSAYVACGSDVGVGVQTGMHTFTLVGRDSGGTVVESGSYSWEAI
jgi:hypothetical protein